MKKRAVVFAAALVVALAATAAETTADEAKLAVVGWENVRAALDGEVTAAPESVVEYPAKDGKGKFYVVKLAGGGFVVVSGNTELVPVLAYSKDGNWTMADGWRNSSEEEYTPWNPAFGGPYDWEAMASGDSTAKKQAIGRLTRDVGLASKMNYASGGSIAR